MQIKGNTIYGEKSISRISSREVSMAKLYIYPKEGDAFQFRLAEEKISVGRSPDNDIPLPDRFCSAHHAFFYLDEKGYVIRNNKSKNGTILNGMRISAEAELKSGDEILIGTRRIVYDKDNSSKYQQ
jgi:pSer/pThr/pTyr-binding forkhead associated (FHA) protein